MTGRTTDKRRIIFVNRFAWPDHSATSQILGDVAQGLVAGGWNVAIIASRLRYDDAGAPLLPSVEWHSGVEIIRVPTSRFGRHGLIGRFIDYATFYIAACLEASRQLKRGDILVVKTDPPLLQIPMTAVARLRGAWQVNWLQDLYPEVAAALGLRIFDGPLGWLLKSARRWSFRHSVRNVAIGERMASLIADNGAPQKSIRVVGNFAGDELTTDEPTGDRLRGDWDLAANELVIGYSGNLGRAHDVGTVLGAAALLSPNDDGEAGGYRFLFIGGGALRRQIEANATRDTFVFQPYQPRDKLPQSLAVPDVHWLSLQPGLEGLIVPSKFYGAAASGRPVIFIGDPDGEVARLVRHYECGWTFAPGDDAGLAEFIRNLKGQPSVLKEKGAKARAAVLERHTAAVACRAWDRLLAEIIEEENA